jgi:hypothetical protein
LFEGANVRTKSFDKEQERLQELSENAKMGQNMKVTEKK